jgi:hypothetical protein
MTGRFPSRPARIPPPRICPVFTRRAPPDSPGVDPWPAALSRYCPVETGLLPVLAFGRRRVVFGSPLASDPLQ